MSRAFYAKLALTNIRKNAQTYYPYMMAGSAAVMMFYNMLYLRMSGEIGAMHDSMTVRTVLFLGCIVTGFFSFLLLLYINSFLIKRRKKEFGLFNILGMEKKHIARIMLIETALTALVCIGLGILAGILFGKLALLLLLNILGMDASYGFDVPPRAVIMTAVLFGAAFLVNLLYNVFQVHVSKPVELLKGGNVGEKEPRTKWLIAIVGIAALGAGYVMAITVKSPVAALYEFFIAVMLVIIGTYCLFTAGSIAILKTLRRNKRFYYRTNPFIAVSGMIYRMKQNAAGLASICILSTMVIIMLSSTVSLYVGLEDVLRTRYPREIAVMAYHVDDEQIGKLEAAVAEIAEKKGVRPQNPLSLKYVTEVAVHDGQTFIGGRGARYTDKHAALFTFITAEEYNRIEGARAELSEGEALVYVEEGKLPGDALRFDGFSLAVREQLDELGLAKEIALNDLLPNSYVVVTAGEADIVRVRQALYGDGKIGIDYAYMYHFDTAADRETQISLVSALYSNLPVDGYADGREASKRDFLSVYGSLFFLGLFLGALFILGTVLIIYYKQISEGFDDKERFAIMLKVGLDHGEIKRTIRFQVLSVFFLPLAMAVCHIAAAFPVISKLLAIFRMTNVPLYALCTGLTILAFAVCYAAIYALTARTYYKIVR
jgi:putative ABC transport system permease protein